MDTSDNDTNCYRDVTCRLEIQACASTTDRGKFDDRWTKKLRTEQTGEWCCYSRTVCEFPVER